MPTKGGQEGREPQLIRRYLGLASQWLAMLVAAVWLGVWLDGKTAWRIPFFTLLLTLSTMTGMLWQVIRDTSQKKKKK